MLTQQYNFYLIMTIQYNFYRTLAKQCNFYLSLTMKAVRILPHTDRELQCSFHTYQKFYVSSVSVFLFPCFSGGKFGDLRVYYQTQGIDLLTEVYRNGSSVFDFYSVAKLGRSTDSTGSNVTLSAQDRPLDVRKPIRVIYELCSQG